jgi:hypothetical protein
MSLSDEDVQRIAGKLAQYFRSTGIAIDEAPSSALIEVYAFCHANRICVYPNSGHRVYFAQCSDGPIKIGITEGDPSDRLKSLNTACPYLVTLVGAIRGCYGVERGLHAMFGDLRLNGEWFKPDEKLTSFIDRLLKGL